MMKFGVKCAWFLALSIPAVAMANPLDQTKKVNFTVKEFNLEHYKTCSALLHQCPVTGPVLDQTCVEKSVKDNTFCDQLKSLSSAIDADPAAVAIEPEGKFLLVDQLFVADGQHAYYLILPVGEAMKMDVDPRDFNAALKKKYKDMQFMETHVDKPKSSVQPDGSQSFTFTMKITDTCRACKEIGYAKMKFNFAKTGKLEKISVDQFSKNEK